MKKLNKVLFFCSAGLLALSITSCKSKDIRNTSVPMGNLNTSLVLASSKDNKVQMMFSIQDYVIKAIILY